MIYTFYSYKGGVGRTMALCNIAVLLLEHNLKVLTVDFDLEAPGLERYFEKFETKYPDEKHGIGLLDLLVKAKTCNSPEEWPNWRDYITIFTLPGGKISSIIAGRVDEKYAKKLESFNWNEFFHNNEGGEFFELLREEWISEYDVILIDSRTGLSDSGGVCTIQMPDVLIPVFTANYQSLYGVRDAIQMAQNSRQNLDYDRMPLQVLPLPSRWDGRAEVAESIEWLNLFADTLEHCYSSWLPNDITPYEVIEKTKVPHVPHFSFGEKLPVLTHGVSDPELPGYAYNLYALLIAKRLNDAGHLLGLPLTDRLKDRLDNFVFNVPYREKGDGVVGRENTLQKLRKQLTESRGTAIGQTASFHGMGGLGKTQLAVEYAHRFKYKYPNGIIWINADQEIDSQLIQLAKMADWIAPESEHKVILDIARRRLKTYSDCLIIYDNVENQEDIKPYFPEPGATPHLILTSRIPQPGFEPIQLNILDNKSSLDLLMMESGRSLEFLSPEEKDAANRIAIELGGLPLAIELAGAYLKYLSSFSFANYLALLENKPKSAIAGKMISSFTDHESDIFKTLKVTELVLEKEPLLKDIINVLTWSGSSFIGTSLLSAILNVTEKELFRPLKFGTELRLFRKDEGQDRYEIHRLLKKVHQEGFTLNSNREWAENVCNRLGSWFESRREDFFEVAKYELEIDHLKQWFENAKAINSIHDSRLLWLQAYSPYHWGKYDETLGLVKSALDLYEDKYSLDTELNAHIINDLGAAYGQSGNYTKQLEFHDRALKIREKQLGPDHPDTALSLDNVGLAYGDLGEHKKALEFQVRALKIRENQLGPDHPDTARSLDNVGSTYGQLGDQKKALEFKEQALKIWEKQLGSDHPDTARSLNNVGLTYSYLGEHKKALEFKERALKIWEKQLGPDLGCLK